MAKVTVNARKTLRAMSRLTASLRQPGAIKRAMLTAHKQIIEKRVRRDFLVSRKQASTVYGGESVPKGNTSITGEYVGGQGIFSQLIAHNITSGVISDGISLTAGTGKIKLLDEKDPIRRLNQPTRRLQDNTRIWRFLEAGVPPLSRQIAPRNKNGVLTLFNGQSWNIVNHPVNHPGQEARSAFFEDGTAFSEKRPHESDLRVVTAIKIAVEKHVKRFSAKE